jgi:hypothetical protein
VLLVAGILLLPPAALTSLAAGLLGRRARLPGLLQPDEKILYQGRAHWGVFLPSALVLLLIVVLAAGPFGVTGYTAAGVLYRLLRALSSAGVVSEFPERRFALTPLGRVLRSDVPGSMRALVLFCGEPFYLQAWQEILYSVQTGKPAWDKVHGMAVFDYYRQHPEAARIFDEAMTSLSWAEAHAVVRAFDFSRFRTLVDVGGGQPSPKLPLPLCGINSTLFSRGHSNQQPRRTAPG